MTLGDLLREKARRHPEKPVVLTEQEIVSYDELDRSATALARWLLDHDLSAGDRVAIHWSNAVVPVKVFFACFKAGLVAVPINTRFKADEIAYVLQHSGARVCFSQPELASAARERIASCPSLYRLLTELPECESVNDDLPAVGPTQPAAILYTSGSTANPKGVTHTHETLCAMARLVGTVVGEEGLHRVLVTTSMMHIGGFAWDLLAAVYASGAVVMLSAFDAPTALDLIERFRCTYTVALPTMIRFLIEEQARKPRNVRSLSRFLSAGDSLPVDSYRRFHQLFGIPVLECLGMTECSPTCWNTADDHRAGSIGKPRNGIAFRVVDMTGSDVPEGDIGELAISSPANFVGYWEDPAATAATLRDGWLFTGDLVRKDAEGYYYFEGRLKHIIIRGGSNISPQQVEEALFQHPSVLEAAVVGVPDAVYGEKVVAFVSLRPDSSASEKRLREFARERLADYKVPEQILFLNSPPKNATGKVQRRQLKEMALGKTDPAHNFEKARV